MEARVIRVLAALAALVAAALLVGIAVDVSRWEHATTRAPSTLVGGAAESLRGTCDATLLGTGDDIALRHAVATFVNAENTPYGFDNGANQARVRALAQGVLADVVSSAPPAESTQADAL